MNMLIDTYKPFPKVIIHFERVMELILEFFVDFYEDTDKKFTDKSED